MYMKPFTVPVDCQIPTISEIYHQYFSNIEYGYFVEVGAYDGRSWTNTGFLADIGWSGLYIEPVKTSADRCKENHKNNKVIVEQCAIGSNEEVKEIYLAEGLSTIDEYIKKAHELMYNQTNLIKENIQIVTLSSILKKHNICKNFELLVVDTEGYEKEVFDSFSFNEYRPKMIIVELCDVHHSYKIVPEAQAKAKMVRDYIENNHYHQIYLDSINTIYVDNE